MNDVLGCCPRFVESVGASGVPVVGDEERRDPAADGVS